jgi:iron complex transport system ATP-binding protein
MTSLLKIEGLKFSWGANQILDNINLEISGNEFVAVLGVNGAGKSTFLKCINRILTPSNGTIAISGNNISDMSLMNLSKATAYVPQSIKTNFSMHVFDIVMLGRRPHISWRISEDDRERVSETLRFLELEDFAFRNFDMLSGGERQRVIIAKSVAQDPQLFLLDEPTSDLDLRNQISIMKKIRQVVSDVKSEKSAIVAIHDINMAARFADRIVLLDRGVIKADGTPSEVLTEANIEDVFGVSCEIIPEKYERVSPRIIIKDEIEI